MQLTIDTKRDSAEEIRRAIEFLQRFVEGQGSASSNIFDDSPQAGGGLFGMFDDMPTTPPDDGPNDEDPSPDESDPSVEIVPY